MSGGRGSFIGRVLGVRSMLAERDRTIAEQRGEIRALKAELAARKPAARKPVVSPGSIEPDSFPKNAFFVIGRARCGTTWLRGILNAHPEIMCWGEGRLFERSLERPELRDVAGEKLTPTSLYGALVRAGYLTDWIENSVWAGDVSVEDHRRDLMRLCARHFMEGRLAGTGARLVGDKTPYRSAEVIPEIASVLPGAKVIHIIRDGRDAAVSYIHHAWSHAASEGSVYDLSPQELKLRDEYREGSLEPPERSIFTPDRLEILASEWAREVPEVRSEGRRLLADDYTEVRYEALLEDPAGETRKLLGFLGAGASAAMVSRCMAKTRFESGSGGRKPGSEDSTARNRKGISGDWKNVFTPEDTERFHSIASHALRSLGYATT